MMQIYPTIVTKLLKLFVMTLLLFVQSGQLNRSFGMEEVSLDTPRQHPSQQIDTDTPLISDYSSPDDQISNCCAFMCGRCQICHSGCYLDSSDLEGKPLDCSLNCYQYTCYCVTGIKIVGSFGASVIWNFVDLFKCAKDVCTLISWIPAISGGGACALCTCHALTGAALYGCAHCMNKGGFKADFKRGLYCTQTDRFSCTNLWKTWKNCWNPCCGKSDTWYERR